MWRFLNSPHNDASSPESRNKRFMLWIDGIGSFLVCLGERVTIGGPVQAGEAADVSLLANLSRKHAAVVRIGEGYLLEAYAPVRVAARNVDERSVLNDGYEIELGSSVRLRFRLPTVLSATATLSFLSDHRPTHSVDGVVLLDETCLLGPGNENHIRCLDWPETVLLYRRDGQFFCKSRGDLFVANRRLGENDPVVPGQVVTGNETCFRIEDIDTRARGNGRGHAFPRPFHAD